VTNAKWLFRSSHWRKLDSKSIDLMSQIGKYGLYKYNSEGEHNVARGIVEPPAATGTGADKAVDAETKKEAPARR